MPLKDPQSILDFQYYPQVGAMGEVDSVVNDQLTIRSQGPDKTLGIMKTLHGDDLSILQCVTDSSSEPA